jgi:hypothetical protein
MLLLNAWLLLARQLLGARVTVRWMTALSEKEPGTVVDPAEMTALSVKPVKVASSVKPAAL